MNGFKFDFADEEIKTISNRFGIKKESIDALIVDYQKLIQDIPYQYLAHIIRTMETYVRKNVKDAQFFRITCEPTPESNEALKGLAGATYHERYSFDIVYDKEMKDKDKRVCIAHELGHLFLVIMQNTEYDAKHEPLSSIYGLLTMIHKLHHKKNNGDSYNSAEALINAFLLLMNRSDGKFNTSQSFQRN